MANPKATSSSADYGKTASFLAVGVGLTGIITYAYFLIASHTLSKPDYGQITLLWSAVFITISTLYRPIEQLLSRHISERLTRGEPINQPMRVASTIQFGLALLFVALALALRGLIEGDLFDGSETIYWVFFSSVLFYAASYFARGFLAGSQRFGLFVALILSESCFRTVFAVLVAVDILTGQSAVAIGITAAPALSLLVVPFAFARRAKREGATRRPEPVEGESGEFSFRSGAGFAAAVLVIMFSEQAFINAGPLITGALKGSAEVGYIFNVLMLARAPLQLFQSVSTSILPHLTSLHASKEPGSDREFARTIRMVLIGIGAFTALVLAVVLVAGPRCMQIAFGKSFTYDRLGLVLVSIGMGSTWPRSRSIRPAPHRARSAGRRPVGSAARSGSSPGTSSRSSATSSAGSRSASCSPRRSCSHFFCGSTTTHARVAVTPLPPDPRRNSRRASRSSTRTSELDPRTRIRPLSSASSEV